MQVEFFKVVDQDSDYFLNCLTRTLKKDTIKALIESDLSSDFTSE